MRHISHLQRHGGEGGAGQQPPAEGGERARICVYLGTERYKTSYSLSKKRRLLDLLLPGTAAVYQAIPSGPRMRLSHEALAFRISNSSV